MARFLKRLLLAAITLAVLLVAALALLNWRFTDWVVPRLETALASRGLERLETSDPRWRWGRVRFDRVEVAGTADGYGYHLVFRELDTGFHWRHLLAGRLGAIDVGRLGGDIVLPATDSEVDAPPPPAAVARADLRPANWLPPAPFERLRVEQLALEVSPLPLAETLRVTGRAIVADTGSARLRGDFRLQGADKALPPLTLAIDATADQRLAADIRLGDSDAALLRARLDWRGGERLALNGTADLGGWRTLLARRSAPALAEAMAMLPSGFAGESRFDIDLALPEVVVSEGALALDALAVSGHLEHRLAIPAWPGYGLSDLGLNGAHRVEGTANKLVLRPVAPLEISARLDTGTLSLPAVHGESLSLALEITADQPLVITPASLALAEAELELTATGGETDIGLRTELSDLEYSAGRFGVTLANRLTGQWRGKAVPALDLTAIVNGDAGHWQGEGRLSQEETDTSGSWRGSLGEGEEVDIAARATLAAMPALMARVMEWRPLPVSVALSEGQLELGYRLQGGLGENTSWRQRLDIAASGLNGLVGGMAVQQGAVTGAFEISEQWSSVEPLAVSADVLETGVALERPSLEARMLPGPDPATNAWRVTSLGADLLGGSVSLAQPFVFDPGAESNAFELVLSNWQLDLVLALYQQQGLSGGGLFNGRLPVRIGSGGVAVSDGYIRSEPPGGVIHYDIGAAGRSVSSRVEELGMALRLLDNFVYDNLAADVALSADGQLNLGVNLSGRNPDEFEGRPVNFNIHVEDNLYNLLRTLQLGSDLIDSIEGRIRRQGGGKVQSGDKGH